MTLPHTQSVGSVGEKWVNLQDKHHNVTIRKKKKKKKTKQKQKQKKKTKTNKQKKTNKTKKPLMLTFKYSTLAKTMFSF